MPDALTEALDALRVLGDPAKAWGHPKHIRMHTFADAARKHVVALRDASQTGTGPGNGSPRGSSAGKRPSGQEHRQDKAEVEGSNPSPGVTQPEALTTPATRDHAEVWLATWRKRGFEVELEERGSKWVVVA